MSTSGKNNRYVCTKSVHTCKYCKEIIPQGSRHIHTVNPMHGDRFWICNTCNSLLIDIQAATHRRNCLAFDDDGAWIAYTEGISQCVGEFLDRCKDDEMYERVSKLH